MAVKIEPNSLGDGIKWEESSDYSREKVTILSGQNLEVLEVVGKVTASGKYVSFNQDGADGSEDAAGIMVAACDASLADKEGVIINKHAMMTSDNLIWPGDIDAGEQIAAVAQLVALGIIDRTQA